MNPKTGKILRTAAIILIGMTAAMNILGGVGTSCAAFFTRDFPPLWSLYDYRWLYQALVITTTLVGIAGVWGTVTLAQGKKNAYRNVMIILLVGTLLALVQYIASAILRGKTTPANVKFFTNALTLLFFAGLRLPSIRKYVDFEAHEDSPDLAIGGGLAAIVAGGVIMTVNSWVGSSHIYQGENWVSVIQRPLNLSGAFLVATGIATLVWVVLSVIRRETEQARLPDSERVR
jgi:lysylphosphatidylglycerol synthetase-like protein (DUF2156 family)